MLSVSSKRKHNFYHQNTLLDAFRTNFRNIIGRNPSMVIPLIANQDLTPMLAMYCNRTRKEMELNINIFILHHKPPLYQLSINIAILPLEVFQYGPTLKSLIWGQRVAERQ